ncbi:hypothetical protein CYPRO_2058 [Cyclonatronum proteinivorum]|uniref:Uncharacterized protein n=1 Tax=Cyclonatronum proteinivorum TaxID=1457365 RepID=A0A345ULF6_9BACT|nr:hypothetical protein [Cyclonatronum proteinivorum]AXJ01308.1 hypothetical protein CYPRO_2058 [Cyclonatronum proteinivorum]
MLKFSHNIRLYAKISAPQNADAQTSKKNMFPHHGPDKRFMLLFFLGKPREHQELREQIKNPKSKIGPLLFWGSTLRIAAEQISHTCAALAAGKFPGE